MKPQRQWQIGDVIYPEAGRGIQSGEATPQWFAFSTPAHKERAAKEWVEKRGADAWFPTETRWRHIPRAKIKRQKYEAVVVPRYLFVRFTGQPQWDVLRTCRYLTGVVGHDGQPMPMSDEQLIQMRSVPQRLAEMKAAKIERETIRQGDKVEICEGPFSGWVVEVQTLRNGLAAFLLPLFGSEHTATAPIQELRKIVH